MYVGKVVSANLGSKHMNAFITSHSLGFWKEIVKYRFYIRTSEKLKC